MEPSNNDLVICRGRGQGTLTGGIYSLLVVHVTLNFSPSQIINNDTRQLYVFFNKNGVLTSTNWSHHRRYHSGKENRVDKIGLI